MKELKKYSIEYKKFGLGNHKSIINIDDNFFKLFDYSEIEKANIKIEVDFEYKNAGILFDLKISGTINTVCDICLEEFDMEVKGKHSFKAKFGEETLDYEDIDDEIIVSRNDDSIDLSKHLYDFIILSLPIKKVHPKDENGNRTCNPEFLKKLSEFETKQEKITDPRWDKLKNIN